MPIESYEHWVHGVAAIVEAPEKTELMKQYLGIDSDYFAAAAPDVLTDDAVEQVYQRLDRLARGR